MAVTLQIKRSTGTSAPGSLANGELAYTHGTGTQGNLGDRLFIGDGSNVNVIGGQYFTDMLDHVAGTLTASGAVIVDSNKAIDELLIGNASGAGGTLKFNEGTSNGSNYVALKAPNSISSNVTWTLPDADGSADQVIKTDGSGALGWTTASSAADDISTGDAAVTISTSSGNITIDAAANNSDIIFKGTDATSDITMLTLDGSEAGAATFNSTITGGGLLTTGGNIVIPDAGNIGSASDTDAIAIASNGVVTFSQAPVLTLGTAAQTNITSLGTLTALTVDDVAIDGKVVTMTGSSGDTATLTVGTNGTLDITTTDTAAAAANIQITADGTAELAGTTVTLDSGGGITLDADSGTITFADGGSSLGTITSDGFTGNVVGNVTGNTSGTAATVTTAAQTNITSLGTLTALTVDDVAIDGKVITMTGSSSDTAVFTAGTNGTLSIVTTDDSAAAANITITADGTFEADGTTVTLDSAGDIVLDADGGDVFFKDGGTTFGSATNTSGNLIIKSGTTTALTFSGANVTGAGTYTGGGTMTTGGNIVIPDAGNIGSASDTDAIAISSGGVVTFSQAPVFANGSLDILDLDIDGGTDIGAALVDADLIIVDDGAGGTNRKSAMSRVKTYVADVTLTTAAQTAITSVGTLNGLAVAGSQTITMGSNRVTNVADPSSAQDAATKAYVDAVKTGLDVKDSVVAASTGNGTLSSAYENGDTLDGVTLSTGDRILLKDQSTGSENGIYTVNSSGAPTRATDFDSNAEVTSGAFTFVTEGTTNGDSGFVLTTNDDITVGTTAMTWAQFSGAGQITAGSALTKSGNTLNVGVDDSSIEVSSDALRVKASGITNAMLAGSIDLTAKVTGALPVGNGGTGLTAAAKGTVIVANSANTLSALDGGGSNDSILAYTASSDTIAWATTVDGGTF
jgi:hypothetical protein